MSVKGFNIGISISLGDMEDTIEYIGDGHQDYEYTDDIESKFSIDEKLFTSTTEVVDNEAKIEEETNYNGGDFEKEVINRMNTETTYNKITEVSSNNIELGDLDDIEIDDDYGEDEDDLDDLDNMEFEFDDQDEDDEDDQEDININIDDDDDDDQEDININIEDDDDDQEDININIEDDDDDQEDINIEDDEDDQEDININETEIKRALINEVKAEALNVKKSDSESQLLSEANKQIEIERQLRRESEIRALQAEKRIKLEQLKAEKVKQLKEQKVKDLIAGSIQSKQSNNIDYSKYDDEALYSEVRRYLVSLGIDKSVVNLSDLDIKFGKDNIRKLILRSYLIQIGRGVTLGK